MMRSPSQTHTLVSPMRRILGVTPSATHTRTHTHTHARTRTHRRHATLHTYSQTHPHHKTPHTHTLIAHAHYTHKATHPDSHIHTPLTQTQIARAYTTFPHQSPPQTHPCPYHTYDALTQHTTHTTHAQDQAQKLAQRLSHSDIAAVYCSPMKRTVRTAEILAAPHKLPLKVRC